LHLRKKKHKNYSMSETNKQNAHLSALNLWYRITNAALSELPYDLSQRQIAVLLSVYMAPPPHTVRGLAERLSISKPAICRALDALSQMDFIRRKKDEKDRRNVHIQRTISGSVFLHDFADIIERCKTDAPAKKKMPMRANKAAAKTSS
jgi:DNA-binding MarR family transcriptional regulator